MKRGRGRQPETELLRLENRIAALVSTKLRAEPGITQTRARKDIAAYLRTSVSKVNRACGKMTTLDPNDVGAFALRIQLDVDPDAWAAEIKFVRRELARISENRGGRKKRRPI